MGALCEARAIIPVLRDYPPKELELWSKHISAAQATGADPVSALPALHKDMLEQGFVAEGW